MVFSFILLHSRLPCNTNQPFIHSPTLIRLFLSIYTVSVFEFLVSSIHRNHISLISSLRRSTTYEEMTSPDQQEVDMKILRAKNCSNEAVKAGAKAAAIACVASAIPTLLGARAIPWARANLNHAAQALIISTISGSAYFIVADKTILKSARRNSFREQMENQAEYWPF